MLLQLNAVLKTNVNVFFALFFAIGIMAQTSSAQPSNTQDSQSYSDIETLEKQFSNLHRSPEIVAEIENVIYSLNSDAEITYRIDLDWWKLRALADVGDTRATSNFALQIYNNYDLQDYRSKVQFGDVMQEVVQAFTKTKELEVALEIIQEMRESVYSTPNTYLSFIIDKCLMEVYIETFDYTRALEVELSVLYNTEYQSLEIFSSYKSSLYNEIAFLYNRLENSEKALEYLEYAREDFEQKDLHPSDLIKARALNSGNRGRAYILQGKYVKAKEMGENVLSAGEYLGENYLRALGYRLIGSATSKLGETDLALKNLKMGITLSQQHNLVTMQKHLYRDYAETYESLNAYKTAIYWYKKQFEVEYAAQQSVALAREALRSAEDNALNNYEEVQSLRRDNEVQRQISAKDRRITHQLTLITTTLLISALILALSLYFVRKNQRKLVLSERKAKENERLAKKANEAKSQFLANMSHEIRTPMNGVMGMAQILAQTSLNEVQKNYVDIISKSGSNLLVIINDILDFSKIEAGKLELVLSDNNLETSIGEVVTLLTPIAAKKDLSINYTYKAKLPKHFTFDEDRVRQILLNLIGNAIKFTNAGSVSILVSESSSKIAPTIKIQITDTGIGIEKDKLPLIFEKFTQAENTRTRSFGGTGLGLTISNSLVNAMNGSLKVSSVYSEGSTFTIRLPLTPVTVETREQVNLPAPEAHADNPETQKTKPNHKPPTARNLKVLIAEDDEINTLIITKFLDLPKVDFTLCSNGADAVKAYELAYFDLILMDVSMPVMDGIEATKAIRSHEKNSGRKPTPIICLSAHVIKDDREKFIKAGMNDYVSKPINKNDLFKAIKNQVKMSNSKTPVSVKSHTSRLAENR